MQTGRSDKRGLTEINVTPLVDIMLVLLIIFMVSAPMMQQGVPLTLPKADAQPAPIQEDEVVISVTSDKSVYIDHARISLGDLGARLAAIRERSSQRKIFLRADERVPYGVVVRVLAIAERVGIHDINLLTEPERL